MNSEQQSQTSSCATKTQWVKKWYNNFRGKNNKEDKYSAE